MLQRHNHEFPLFIEIQILTLVVSYQLFSYFTGTVSKLVIHQIYAKKLVVEHETIRSLFYLLLVSNHRSY